MTIETARRFVVLTGIAAASLAASVLSLGADSDAATSSAADEPDVLALPLGDGRATIAGPQHGFLFVCQPGNPNAPGAAVDGPWINNAAGTYSLPGKFVVDGSNDQPSARFKRKLKRKLLKLTGNGLPTNHGTGNFPIAPSDDAARVDRNPNPVLATTVSAILRARPKKAATPSCATGGVIGIARNGVVFFNAVDARGDDAVAHEVQDACSGHPQQQGQYHYHGLPACLSYGSEKRHSKLIGWILDGFPIYGPIGEGGEYMRTSDLDQCHGHTHKIKYLGETAKLYHYHATAEYPYTIGCFRGTPRN
jgi:hypothetical protein